MARVCLILPLTSTETLSSDWLARCVDGLESSGHTVEVLAVLERAAASPGLPPHQALTWIDSSALGLSAAAMTGLADAEGDYLVVVDAARGYHPGDVARVIDPLARSEADLVVARSLPADKLGPGTSTRSGWAAVASRLLARPLLGVSDPFAGLVALNAEVAQKVVGSFVPVGDRFVVDLLVRTKGRRTEVPVRTECPNTPVPLSIDDLRHLKRLADDQFGNASRLIQFCAVGASGMVVDLTSYAIFQLVFSQTWLKALQAPVIGGSLDLAVAGALAIALALTWNFSLNRRLTFNDARHGSIIQQYLTYALSNAVGIALSLCLRLSLPAHFGFFDRHRLAAAAVGIVAATGISFSMARWVVFNRNTHAKPGSGPGAHLTSRRDTSRQVVTPAGES
jgi:dolichol-phosphate mannosyltransferase